jgi:hypothetical protein
VAATVKAKLSYAVTFNYHSSYENGREGDRIIQDANPPIRNNQYNAYAYTPGTFPPASPPLLPPPRAGQGFGADARPGRAHCRTEEPERAAAGAAAEHQTATAATGCAAAAAAACAAAARATQGTD